MKKSIKTFIAIIMAVMMIFSSSTVALASSVTDEEAETTTLEEYISDNSNPTQKGANFKIGLAKLLNKVLNFLLNKVVFNFACKFIRDADTVTALSDFKLEEYGDFYSGTEVFLDEAADNARWQLGYARESIIPDDFGTPKKYARGSYIPYWYSTEIYKDEDGNTEDLMVRTVALNDGSGRGTVIFSAIDCIGLSNTDVRKIRAAVADYAAENNIISINISATHTHTGIDTQGAWNQPFQAVFNNLFSSKEPISGIQPDFLAKLIDSTKNSIIAANEDLKSGELTYSRYDASSYVRDRTAPLVCDPDLYRLEFVPDEQTATPTIIASFGTHPEITSYDWLDGTKKDTKLTADFVYYMEKAMNAAGYNFIYIQGNVGTNTTSRGLSADGLALSGNHEACMRYGYEMAYITLALDKTIDECIALNLATGDLLGVNEYSQNEKYTVWYEDWTPVGEEAVEPFLNIRHEQLLVEMESNVCVLLCKAGIVTNKTIKDKNTYYTVTEIGYMEIGDSLKVFLNPGELYSELLMGCDELEDFEYPALRETYGEDLIVFDLVNDAAGYMEPDNYYALVGFQYNPANNKLDSESWCLLVSLGKNTASTIIKEFMALVDGIAA